MHIFFQEIVIWFPPLIPICQVEWYDGVVGDFFLFCKVKNNMLVLFTKRFFLLVLICVKVPRNTMAIRIIFDIRYFSLLFEDNYFIQWRLMQPILWWFGGYYWDAYHTDAQVSLFCRSCDFLRVFPNLCLLGLFKKIDCRSPCVA